MGQIVGIDLGTTNSVVGVIEAGRPVVIANSEGTRTTPSIVGFTKNSEIVIGDQARRQLVLNPKNTFYNLKRFIGRDWDELDETSISVPYNVKSNDRGSVRILSPFTEREYAPEELISSIIRKLINDAETYLGNTIDSAVITVPAYFNESQRQATKDSAVLAGIKVDRILNEPTAAALAYGFEKSSSNNVLVFDLGGGTFDVSLLRISNGVFDVKATCGDTQLGGNNFDSKIVDWIAERFLEKHKIDLRRDRQALQRLTEAAEKAKCELSGLQKTKISLPFITTSDDGPLHIEEEFDRKLFESLSDDLLDRLLEPVQIALEDSGWDAEEIDEVVLVGGSTRIPMVQQLVKTLVPNEPCQSVNPDEVVAIGAAIQSGIISGDLRDLLLNDVTPLSLGLETIGGLMKVLIPRNTPIPVRQSDVFSTSESNQSSVVVQVRQGERPLASENKSLGKFRLSGIPPAPRGIPQVQVAFDIDANGLLEVSATDRTTGRKQTVSISGGSNLNEQEINMMIAEAKSKATEDRMKRSVIDRKNNALTLIAQAERRLRDASLEFGPYGAERQQRAVELAIQDVEEFIDDDDPQELEISVSSLQEALFGLNRRFAAEKKVDSNPLQGIKNTFGSLKDELFSDDYWDDDPWDNQMNSNSRNSRYGNSRDDDPWDNDYFL
jgi:molecular chaperone DnaK